MVVTLMVECEHHCYAELWLSLLFAKIALTFDAEGMLRMSPDIT